LAKVKPAITSLPKPSQTFTGAPWRASSLSQGPPEGGEDSGAHHRLPSPSRAKHLPHDALGKHRKS